MEEKTFFKKGYFFFPFPFSLRFRAMAKRIAIPHMIKKNKLLEESLREAPK
jgi:hypothetical protein